MAASSEPQVEKLKWCEAQTHCPKKFSTGKGWGGESWYNNYNMYIVWEFVEVFEKGCSYLKFQNTFKISEQAEAAWSLDFAFKII